MRLTPTPTKPLPFQVGDQCRLDGDPWPWNITAVTPNFAAATRIEVSTTVYTVIDWRNGVRGPCNLVGQSYGDGTYSLAECAALLDEFETGDLEISHRNWLPLQIDSEISRASRHVRITQEELFTEATLRFGADPLDFKFTCPHCGDVTTLREWKKLIGNTDRGGQDCIGRVKLAVRREAGIPEKRGCDWAAYGLFRGPWEIVVKGVDDKGQETERSIFGFPLAGDIAPGGPVARALGLEPALAASSDEPQPAAP